MGNRSEKNGKRILEIASNIFYIIAVGILPIVIGVILYRDLGVTLYLLLILVGIMALILGFVRIMKLMKNKHY
ncbi:DUF308 domain-containing protein [Corticicoccus populi]|uniref:DUF308 domain-containing protein n=1 Tax=Corticicoccus populi TaxID=1812821 RepID=A0ABW5WUM9_9STAP